MTTESAYLLSDLDLQWSDGYLELLLAGALDAESEQTHHVIVSATALSHKHR